MCFEVILPILAAAFCIFGVYALLHFVWQTWFAYGNLSVAILVDTKEVATHFDVYLKEARRVPLSHSGVTVLVCREYADEALLRLLKRRGLSYCIIDDMEKRV